MKITGEGQLLRIFIDENDRFQGEPLYRAIVLKAKEQGLAGATVLRGIEGYGAASRIRTTKILRISEELPIVIEIADKKERIDKILPILDDMVEEGLITLEKIQIIAYR